MLEGAAVDGRDPPGAPVNEIVVVRKAGGASSPLRTPPSAFPLPSRVSVRTHSAVTRGLTSRKRVKIGSRSRSYSYEWIYPPDVSVRVQSGHRAEGPRAPCPIHNGKFERALFDFRAKVELGLLSFQSKGIHLTG